MVKSARVGYSKMLLGVYAYFIEHKQRNTLIWLPTDGDAENFMKTHVEPTIRDIPSLLALAPWYGKKHRDNTLTMKRFSNGRGFWCLGGKAAKNYREKSVDVAGYDELAAFDEDIEQEGSPTFLGDKRIEGSVWPKSIRGSTPKVRGTCQIERAASESPHFMRFHVACPHCGEEQYLKFGDKETPFGLKWTPDDPSSVFYLCEHNACVIRQQELDFTDARYICEKTGIWTRDGILWFSSSGEEIEPPDSVTFHIWTAYSPFTTWVQIVKDWMKTKGDTGKRKTFVNTTLGETWEAKIGERPDAEVMAERKEHYSAPVPDRVAYLTAGIDSQLDRYEMRVWGWGPGEESWLIDRQIIMGRHDDEQTLLRVDEAINKTYTRRNGAEMSVSRICWDTGGIDPTIVYERSKKHGLFRVIPIKGASVYGKPVASMPRKRNKNGVYLTEIGTDTAKEQIYNRFTLTPEGDEPLPGAVHFPNNPDIFDLTEAQQLTAEEQVEKWVDGRKKILWDSKKRRNEALDCFVYALAALRISISRWQLDLSALLASLQEDDGAATNKKTLADYARALAASINIKPGHDYYFYIRSVNTVGKSAFVEAVGQASDDAEGYLDFFKGQITESHLGKELLEKVELTEDNASRLEEFSKEWQDANDKWNAMWGVKIEQTKDGKHYVAGMRGWTIKGKPASGRAVLSQEQDGIKSHTHSASASSTDLGTKTTSSFDYGTKSTNNTGAHTHSLSGSTNAAGNHSHRDGRRFNPSVFKDTYQYGYTSSGQNTWGVQGSVGMSTGWLANTSTDGNHSHSLSGTAASAGAHAHTVGIGAHTHSVAIGSHGHTITVNAAGNAENTVKNIAFNYIVRLA